MSHLMITVRSISSIYFLLLTYDAATIDARDKWHRLEWVIDDNIQSAIVKAQESALAAIEDSDDSVHWFADFGSDWIKNTGAFAFQNL